MMSPARDEVRNVASKPRLQAAGVLLLLAVAGVRAQEPAWQSHEEIRAVAAAAFAATDARTRVAVDSALRLTRCRRPLQAIVSGPSTAQVRCADHPGWQLYVPVRVHREADVVVLTAPAAPGVPLAAHQLQVRRQEVGSGAGFSDPAVLVGRIPRRALALGAAPTESDLALGKPLRRGDPVVLVARTGGVEVRMQGRALGPAQAGGRIAVENPSSRRILRGRVVADGVVEVVP